METVNNFHTLIGKMHYISSTEKTKKCWTCVKASLECPLLKMAGASTFLFNTIIERVLLIDHPFICMFSCKIKIIYIRPILFSFWKWTNVFWHAFRIAGLNISLSQEEKINLWPLLLIAIVCTLSKMASIFVTSSDLVVCCTTLKVL